MPAGEYPGNLIIEAGATFHRTFQRKLGDVPVPYPAGATAAWMVRSSRDANGEVLSDVSAAPGGVGLTGISVDEPSGTVDLVIADEDTAQYTWEEGYFAIELTYLDGTVDRLIEGMVKVSPEVVR